MTIPLIIRDYLAREQPDPRTAKQIRADLQRIEKQTFGQADVDAALASLAAEKWAAKVLGGWVYRPEVPVVQGALFDD